MPAVAGLAHLADRLVEEHVLRGAAAAGGVVRGAAPVHEERLAAGEVGVEAAVERHGRALADDEAVRRERRDHAPGDALDARDRQQDRARIECGRDVEFRPPHVLPGGRRELQLGVVGGLFLVHFLEADLREAGEEARRHRPSVRLDDRRAGGRREAAADGGDAAGLDEDVRVLERAGLAGRVHARALDEDVLRVGDACGQLVARRMAASAHGLHCRKSDHGLRRASSGRSARRRRRRPGRRARRR